MSKNLTINKTRKILKEKLKNYNGEEHIKLDIEPSILRELIFRKRIDDLIYVQSLVYGFNMVDAKKEATYYTFAIDLDLLKKLDLSGVDFFKVDVRGKNFAGSKGISISPQFVYLKDFSYTTLTDVKILATFHDCKIVGTNFEGSKGAIIKPRTVYSRDLSNAVLKDVLIQGYLDGCNIEGTVFDEDINIDNLYRSQAKKIINNINKAFYEPYDNKPISIKSKTKKRRKIY